MIEGKVFGVSVEANLIVARIDKGEWCLANDLYVLSESGHISPLTNQHTILVPVFTLLQRTLTSTTLED